MSRRRPRDRPNRVGRPTEDRRERWRQRFAGDDRAVSTTLGYVLSLAIASILISGLMLATAGFVEGQREQVIRSELEVVGQTLIADTEGADRLAAAVDGPVTVRSTLPRRVGSSAYAIEIRSDGYDGQVGNGQTVVLSAASVDVSVTLRIVTNTTLVASSVDGGELVVVSDGSTLEVREA